jgi:adenine-specific DNA-methyltransferase
LSKNQKIYIGDCRSVLKKLSDNSISLAITSPPYNIGKNYGKYKDKVSLDDWKELIKEVFILLKKKLKKNGSFFLNVSPVPNNKRLFLLMQYAIL